MATPAPPPGHDEIVVAPPAGRYLCNSREHARLGVPAKVMVTFGQLGTRWHRDALWQGNWGRTFPLCDRCWHGIKAVAQDRRAGLVITEISVPAEAVRPQPGPGQHLSPAQEPPPRGAPPGAFTE